MKLFFNLNQLNSTLHDVRTHAKFSLNFYKFTLNFTALYYSQTHSRLTQDSLKTHSRHKTNSEHQQQDAWGSKDSTGPSQSAG